MKILINEDIDRLMSLSYAKQRAHLNSKPNIITIQNDWPFIFCARWALQHFKELVGIDLMTVMREAMTLKGPRIVKYFQRLGKVAKKEGGRYCDS